MSREKKSTKRKEEEEPPPAKVAAKKRKIVITQNNAAPATAAVNIAPSKSSRNATPHTPPSSSVSTPSSPNSYPFKNPNYVRPSKHSKKQTWKNMKQILASEPYSQLPVNVATYVNIEASPSILPSRKYCDITGFVAPYRDPRTGMRYASSTAFEYIKHLPDEVVQQYLGLRKAAVVLK